MFFLNFPKLIIVFLLVSGANLQALSQLKVENYCCETVHISVGYWDYPNLAWVASGWWKVEPCEKVLNVENQEMVEEWECKEKVLIDKPLDRRYYYFYAYSDSYEWLGEYSFCCKLEDNYIYYDKLECAQKKNFRIEDTGNKTEHLIMLTCPCSGRPNLQNEKLDVPDIIK